MQNLAERIDELSVETDCLGIFWLCQAGFVFKSSSNQIVYIDPYLSDLVERTAGFKRMMQAPIAAEDVVADLVVCTHEHPDHMDVDALPVIAQRQKTRFAGPIECFNTFLRMNIPQDRCYLLEEGNEISIDGTMVKAVYADHGTLAPDAVGIVVDVGGIRVYHTGDTAYRPDKFEHAVSLRPDILIPCINGRYGNMDALEAAQLVRDVAPRLAIASHFWMFVAHNGDPGAFLANCAKLAPRVSAVVMKPGEGIVFRKRGKNGPAS